MGDWCTHADYSRTCHVPALRSAKPEFEKLSVTSEVYDDKCNIKLGAVAQYLFQRRGPLATTGCDHGAFVRTSCECIGAGGLGIFACRWALGGYMERVVGGLLGDVEAGWLGG